MSLSMDDPATKSADQSVINNTLTRCTSVDDSSTQRWLSLAVRIALPSALGILLFSVAVFAIILPRFEYTVLERKQEMLRNQIMSALTILERYVERVEIGEMTPADAQERALAHLRNIRYGEDLKDYIWVNDMQPRMIMHPYRPDLEGRDLTAYEDPAGKRLFVEAVSRVRESGGGYIRYMWQWKDDPRRIVPKLSYVHGFAPWGWVLGTGVYLEDVAALTRSLTMNIATAAGGVLLLVALLSAFVVWQSARIEKQRLEAEAALRFSEDRYQFALEGARIGVWDWEVQSGRVIFDERWGEMLGYELSELKPHVSTWERLVHPADMPHVQQALNEHLEGRRPYYETEHRLRRKDGSWCWVLDRGQVVTRDREGKPLRATGTHLDITARKEAEAELRRQKERAQKYLNVAAVMLVALDSDGTIAAINPKGCEVLGCRREDEIVGLNWFDNFLPHVVRAEVRRVFNALIRGEVSPHEFEEGPILTRDGQERLIAWHNTILTDDQGRITGTLSSGEDITDQRREQQEREALQQQLNQAQKMEAVGQLAGGVAHDFNNLLTIVLGSIDQLKETLANNRGVREPLAALENAADQACSVTRSLLTFSHKLPTTKKMVDLAQVVRDSGKLLRRVLPASIDLVIEARGMGEVWLHADATQLQQVLLNLVVNARDAMPEGGRLEVALEPARGAEAADLELSPDGESFICLRVSDTGIGMTSDVQARIFEPFFSTKVREQGTGLGLAIVHSIVKEHGGRVLVQSQVGVGTTFRIVVPRCASATALSEAPPVGAPPRGRGERILIAEDNIHAREIMAARLSTLGYEVIQVGDGEAALQWYRDYRSAIRLLILDVDMPRRGGVSCLREIRAMGDAPPVVLVTGSVGNTLEEELDRRTLLLRKPFQMDELGRVVSILLTPREEQV